MGHATHFLSRLQRIGDARQLDLALGLYRDPLAVRIILDETDLPPEADRAALALADGPDPAHVIVARDGGFVTCLGPGMRLGGAHPIARAALDEAMARSAAVGRADARIRWRGGLDALLERLVEGGFRLSREDFDALYTLAPAMQHELRHMLADAGEALFEIQASLTRRMLKRRNPKLDQLLHGYARMSASFGHLFLLCIPGALADLGDEAESAEDVARVTSGSMITADSATVLRSVHLAAALGPSAVPGFAQQWRSATPREMLSVVLCLVAIAARHPEARDAVGAVIRGAISPHAAGTSLEPTLRELAEEGLHLAEKPEAVVEAVRGSARDAARARGLPVDGLPPALFDALHGASTIPLMHSAESLQLMPMQAVWAAVIDPRDLYLPAEHIDALAVRVDLDEVRQRLLIGIAMEGRSTPVRSSPKVGRNAPCPCGSGRKHKRCCLGG